MNIDEQIKMETNNDLTIAVKQPQPKKSFGSSFNEDIIKEMCQFIEINKLKCKKEQEQMAMVAKILTYYQPNEKNITANILMDLTAAIDSERKLKGYVKGMDSAARTNSEQEYVNSVRYFKMQAQLKRLYIMLLNKSKNQESTAKDAETKSGVEYLLPESINARMSNQSLQATKKEERVSITKLTLMEAGDTAVHQQSTHNDRMSLSQNLKGLRKEAAVNDSSEIEESMIMGIKSPPSAKLNAKIRPRASNHRINVQQPFDMGVLASSSEINEQQKMDRDNNEKLASRVE